MTVNLLLDTICKMPLSKLQGAKLPASADFHGMFRQCD